MRIVLISDTHTRQSAITLPDGDVLIHAGDMSFFGELRELRDFNNWLKIQPHPHKIVIYGNHECGCDPHHSLFDTASAMAIEDATILRNSSVEIDGLKFWGSPHTPTFGEWGFTKDRGEPLRRVWENIPSDVNVLITHGPPAGILDCGLGCTDLRNELTRLSSMRLHVFGHIHGGYGMEKSDGKIFVNAAQLDDAYRHNFRVPFVVDL